MNDKDKKVDMSSYHLMKNIFAVIGLIISIGLVIGLLSTNGIDIGVIKFGYNKLLGLYFRIDI